MRFDAGQHMRLDQRMKLAPRMIQSMEVLQMSSQELEERLEQELASNPTLELRDAGADKRELRNEHDQAERDSREGERPMVVEDEGKNHAPAATDESGSGGTSADDFERLSNLSEEYGDTWASNTYETGDADDYRPRAPRDDGERDKKLDAIANTAARPQSLTDQLLEQWALSEIPSRELARAGEFLIGFIDDDGYLRTPRETLLQQSPPGVTGEHLDAALALLQQTLEPVGLAARDLRECLLLQIDAANKAAGGEDNAPDAGGPLALERALVADHLKDIEVNRLPKIAKATGRSIEEINHAIHGLRRFHPRPGRTLISESPRSITPDAIVEFDEENDRYIARLFHGRLPSVHINPRYVKMSRDRGVDSKTREFVGNNLRSARWLLDAIAQRHHTLLRVINVVLEAQRDFFDQGSQALKPLPMTQVADQLGIHVATVSRAVSEKYLQTPRGIFPLRMFFSGGTETEAGDAMSWAAVQAKLREIIEGEDKRDPLSDDALVEKLKAAGIDIARRTIAKYRKQLKIPTARQRRVF